MPDRENITVVNEQAMMAVRAALLLGSPETSPTMGSSRSQVRMVSSTTSSVVAALGVLPSKDDAPRVIQQFTSVFLVSRTGELWRVYDVADPHSSDFQMPEAESSLPYRLFVALAREPETRVHTFTAGAPTAVDPVSLQAQLEESRVRN
jgi:hypothetical protein